MSFIPQHSLILQSDQAAPSQMMMLLHGALGSGQNFKSLARKLVARRPELGVVLVDLRNHGSSHPAPLPHTVEAAAKDLHAVVAALGQSHPELPRPSIVAGHSFGGKVALQCLADWPGELRQVWLLDSNPGTQQVDEGHEVLRVLEAVKGVALPITSRQQMVDALLAQGLSVGLSQWMTTNLKRVDGSYRWTFDLEGIEALLLDYFEQDLWPLLESAQDAAVEVVVAERSDRWSDAMKERALALQGEGRLHYHLLPDAGHWLHVDNPEGLMALLVGRLPGGAQSQETAGGAQ